MDRDYGSFTLDEKVGMLNDESEDLGGVELKSLLADRA